MSQGLCTSCGAAVNLTAGQTETKCQYCESIVMPQQAEAQFTQFSEVKKNKFGGALLLAEMAREAGNYKEALIYYNKVIEQQLDFPEAWLNKGLCLVRALLEPEDHEFTEFNKSWKEAISSWKVAVEYAKGSDAFKKRVALEINKVVTDLFPVLTDEDGSPLWDEPTVDEHTFPDFRKLFLLLESAVALALDLWPTNPAIVKSGILLCEIFLRRVKSEWSDRDFVESKPGKDLVAALLKVKDKYEQVLTRLNPDLAKKFKEARSRVERAKKAKAERAAQEKHRSAEEATPRSIFDKLKKLFG